jgi:hypothetical protein
VNLEKLDELIERLESGLAGRAALPANAEVLAAFAFLGQHFDDRLIAATGLSRRIGETPMCFNQELLADLRSLRASLQEAVMKDAGLQRRLRYEPNQIAQKERIGNTLFAVFLLGYAGFSSWIDDFFIPAKRSKGIHLHGLPVWIMFAATLCAAVVLLSVVVDHYDRRDNEAAYQHIGKRFREIGWGLFGLALVVQVALALGQWLR